MADTYEQNLGQKSSLTTSDFIRVVGSDNVSYKQNIGDVNKTIPLNSVGGLTTEALIDQAYITAHTETPDGTLYRRLIYHGFAHSILGGGVYYLEGYRASSSYGWQRITCYGNPTRVFIRSINNGTWTTWAKEPTRTEMDTLNNMFCDAAWKANADLNTLQTTGVYWISTNPTNAPTGVIWFPLIVTGRTWGTSTDTVRQIVVDSSNTIYTRVFQSSAWTAWYKQPTRAEIDALNSHIKKFSNPSSGGTAEVPLPPTGIIFVLSVYRSPGTDASQEGYGLIKYYNNVVYLTRVVGLSGFSVTLKSNGNAVITMPPYTNVMLICCS